MTARDQVIETAAANGWEIKAVNQMLIFTKPEAYAVAHFDRRGQLLMVSAGTEKDENGVFKRGHWLDMGAKNKRQWLLDWLVL